MLIQAPRTLCSLLTLWNRKACVFFAETANMSRHPSVKWAQRFDILFITIDLPDAQDVKLKLEPEGKFFFSATIGAQKIPYEVDIDLYDKVDVNESKAKIGLRNICYLVKKAEDKLWSRLLKQEGKPPVFLKVDWDKWVDEDEEQAKKPGNDMDFGDIDFSKLNMGGDEGFDIGEDDVSLEDSDTEEEENVEQAPSAGGKPDAKASIAAASGGGEPGENA